jgi:MoaA/NifB/PqqE/SkfB family radical SAM enzyme
MAGEVLWNRTAWVTTSPRNRLRVIMAGMDLDETTRPALEAAMRGGTAKRSPAGDDGIRSNYCRFAHERVLAVAWDGRVAPCLSLLHTHPEYVNEQWRTVEAYTVGCVDEQSPAAIWRTPAYRDFRHRVRAFDFSHCFACGGCLLTERNREDCYGNPFPTCGECLWAQGLVLCP